MTMNTTPVTPLIGSPMTVRTLRDGVGNHALIQTEERSMSVLLADDVTPAISLQLTVAAMRDQASKILARADFIERAAAALLGREQNATTGA
jgi:hypothetical protein